MGVFLCDRTQLLHSRKPFYSRGVSSLVWGGSICDSLIFFQRVWSHIGIKHVRPCYLFILPVGRSFSITYSRRSPHSFVTGLHLFIVKRVGPQKGGRKDHCGCIQRKDENLLEKLMPTQTVGQSNALKPPASSCAKIKTFRSR